MFLEGGGWGGSKGFIINQEGKYKADFNDPWFEGDRVGVGSCNYIPGKNINQIFVIPGKRQCALLYPRKRNESARQIWYSEISRRGGGKRDEVISQEEQKADISGPEWGVRDRCNEIPARGRQIQGRYF